MLNGLSTLQAVATGSEYGSFTWLNTLPGFNQLNLDIGSKLGDSWWLGVPITNIRHVFLALLMTAVVVGLVRVASKKLRDPERALIPEDNLTPRNFFEILLDGIMGMASDAMGEKYARRCLPLVGTIAIYVWFSNVLGLVPGFSPPTDNLNATIAPAIVVFLATHYFGIKEHGVGKYLAHFMGPVWYIAPLYFVIEIFSHVFRVVSLSFRLMGNMIGDHTVIASFLALTTVAWIIPYPVPFYALGLVVCTVQTMVFSLLTIVYIQLAVAHADDH